MTHPIGCTLEIDLLPRICASSDVQLSQNNPEKRPHKLDNHTATGRFLGYTATNKNMYLRDDKTHHTKITIYCTFDEAGLTLPALEQPPSSKALQNMGITEQQEPETTDTNIATPEPMLQVKLLSDNATMPTKATDDAAGYDVYSAKALTITPGQRALIPLDIAATPPQGIYIQLASRSGIAAKHGLDTKTGVIDADFTGNITLVLHNSGAEDFPVNIGDHIAQILIIPVLNPTPTKVDFLTPTTGGDNGFGSMVTSTIWALHHTDPPDSAHVDHESSIMVPSLPYDIYMSQDPFDSVQHITIAVKGDNPYMGMQFRLCPHRNHLQLQNMAISTPGSHIPKWRSVLQNAYLLTFQHQPIHTIEQLEQAVQQAKETGVIKATCTFATDRSYRLHPQKGIPQLYFDQLNTIAKHLQDIEAETERTTPKICATSGHPQEHTTAQPNTLSQLKQCLDWPEWKESRYKMLNQYKEQGMFSNPLPLPSNSNALRMLWTYQQKPRGAESHGVQR